jgi:hypothetical protein
MAYQILILLTVKDKVLEIVYLPILYQPQAILVYTAIKVIQL